MPTIEKLSALEILDSRGRPTVKATCVLRSGATASASTPSGASTGQAEALELRDLDAKRYRGKGCLKAVAHVNGPIHAALAGKAFEDQAALDRALLDLDGTANKSNLGANALLATSLAFARACAVEKRLPLYEQFAAIAGESARRLPRPTVNLFSGGKHAGGQVAIQDVLVVPSGAKTMDEAMAMVHAVYYAAADWCAQKYNMRALSADEGGLAPTCTSSEEMIEAAVASICEAGYRPGVDVALAVDIASSHFFDHATYHLDGEDLDSEAMVGKLRGWCERYPIVSVEDGLAENDWEHWPMLCRHLGDGVLTLGDDLLCTNPQRIKKATDTKACNALLLKVNQIGTLTEAAEARRLAKAAGWRVTVSARSGETEDDWLADLAVGWGGDQIKVGSITQSERLAKYNRLLEIEADTGWPLVDWPGT